MKVTWASKKTLEANSLILDERSRQQAQEGYTPAHDDKHTKGQLALLVAAYALSSCADLPPEFYPTPATNYLRGWLQNFGWPFKPKSPISDLVRAGALILAELERRLRRVDS